MPAHDNHTQPHRTPSVPATRRTRSVSPRPDPRPRRERVSPSTATSVARPVGAPATVWVPPTHATGSGVDRLGPRRRAGGVPVPGRVLVGHDRRARRPVPG